MLACTRVHEYVTIDTIVSYTYEKFTLFFVRFSASWAVCGEPINAKLKRKTARFQLKYSVKHSIITRCRTGKKNRSTNEFVCCDKKITSYERDVFFCLRFLNDFGMAVLLTSWPNVVNVCRKTNTPMP